MKCLVLLSLVLTACSVDDGPTTTSCLTASTDTCSGDDLCFAGSGSSSACAPAFPHAYAITNLSITAPLLAPDGMPWDPDADGTPDLYADISVGGTLVTTTAVNMNSYNATFAGPFTVMLDANVALDVKASDQDDAASQLVYDCAVPMVTAQLLRTRYVLCSGTGVTMNYTIAPM